MSEAEIQKAVIQYAKSKGVLVRRNVVRPGVEQGWPDAEFFFPGGETVFVEFKAPGKKPSKLQQHRIDLLRAQGFSVWVVDDAEEGKRLVESNLWNFT